MQARLIIFAVTTVASAIALYVKRRAIKNYVRRIKKRVVAWLMGVAVTLLLAWILVSNADAVVQWTIHALVMLLGVFGEAAKQNENALIGLVVGGVVLITAIAFIFGRVFQHKKRSRKKADGVLKKLAAKLTSTKQR